MQTVADETGWLIERGDMGAPQWLVIGPAPRSTSWTRNADDAARFSLKRDAERFIRWFENSDPALRATDHKWMTMLADNDAAQAQRVMRVFGTYQRELQKGGLADRLLSPSELLAIAASLTTAHMSGHDTTDDGAAK